MFKSFFLVILIMVESTLKALKRYVKRGVVEANYRCTAFERYYDIRFGSKFPTFHFTVEQDRIIVEEKDKDGHLILYLQYSPSLTEQREFKSEVFDKYCDIFRRIYYDEGYGVCFGGNCGGCYEPVDPANCPLFGSKLYDLYSTLVNRYVRPFLSHLLESKFLIVSCNSRVLSTPHITLQHIGDFTYHGRFAFIHRDVKFIIDCKEPEESIRKAIRVIMDML